LKIENVPRNGKSVRELPAATHQKYPRQAIFAKFQLAMNATGPFIPLLQPAEVVVGTKGIKNLQSNGLWLVDLRNLG